ncbi:hypothetical protein KIL84_007174 [Mauremys mutica]|uniref:Uncharacterized protein n=1 Tax=Mauremys mutica TaxID=74926 RepID=A0A9D4AWR0_9SAUR|nr:hypothetical protein KIL84_007174 [Mauremys mutica]
MSESKERNKNGAAIRTTGAGVSSRTAGDQPGDRSGGVRIQYVSLLGTPCTQSEVCLGGKKESQVETIHFIIIQNLNISALVRVPMSSVLHTLLIIPFQLFLGSTGLMSLSATLALAQDRLPQCAYC